MYCVTTIIAPPHPGIAPRNDAIGTCNFLVFSKKEWISNFVRESKPIKTNNVKPTKTETARYASTIESRITFPKFPVWKAKVRINKPKNDFYNKLPSFAKIIFCLSFIEEMSAFMN